MKLSLFWMRHQHKFIKYSVKNEEIELFGMKDIAQVTRYQCECGYMKVFQGTEYTKEMPDEFVVKN